METKPKSKQEALRERFKKAIAIGAGSLALTGALVACENNSEVEAKPSAPVSQSDGGGGETDPIYSEPTHTDTDPDDTEPTYVDNGVDDVEPEQPAETDDPVTDSPEEYQPSGGYDPTYLSPEEQLNLDMNSMGGTFNEIGEYVPNELPPNPIDPYTIDDTEIQQLDEEGVCLPGWMNCTPEQFGQQMPEQLQSRYNALTLDEQTRVMEETEGDPLFPTIEQILRDREAVYEMNEDGGVASVQHRYPDQCFTFAENGREQGYYSAICDQ